MQGFVCTVFLLVSCTVFAEADKDNHDWPFYLRKCSKTDPNLSQCLTAQANHALEFILPGDANAGIPSFLPFVADKLNLGGNNTFKLHISDAKLTGINHVHVTDMNWNFKAQTVDLKLNYNNAIVLNGNYISVGTLLKRPVRGSGNADLVFVGGEYGANITYNMHYKLLKIQGKEYVQIKDRNCKSDSDFRTNFRNDWISKEQASSDSDFINEHETEVNKMLHNGGVNDLICTVVESSLNPVFNNFPIDLIFES